MTLEVHAFEDGHQVFSSWALNEVTVEKASRERMLEAVVEVDGRPLSRWGCDGVVCATPTGSTAYNFSAGGPVVWPQVEALLMVPISAHALFARPMVVAPTSVLAVELLARTEGAGVLWCDGRRTVDLPPGARIEVRRGTSPVRLVRLHQAPFTDRLVAKFDLPVEGWRGATERRRRNEATDRERDA
jgi:NAD+ kinase